MIEVTASGAACGATVQGVDLSKPMRAEDLKLIRQAWIKHKVLVFPDQNLSDTRLEALTLCFGNFGDEPFFEPIKEGGHVVSLCRKADETAPLP